MKGVILTCKHHDGFCLWPTKTTEHSVRRNPWRNGQGDVVKEIADAARKKGLAFGVYLSPWDRNHAQYGKPGYIQVYRRQLRELANYGPIFEVWHDGANGGDGFYGGAREKRTISTRRATTIGRAPGKWFRNFRPDAVIFSDAGPDIRWVGNESGFANETSWATYDPVGPDGGEPAPGHTRCKEGGSGHRNAKRWLPAECDVSIRPGWFFHENQNDKVKTPRQLMDLYYKSVGRGASFLLNVPARPPRPAARRGRGIAGRIRQAAPPSRRAKAPSTSSASAKTSAGQRIDAIEVEIDRALRLARHRPRHQRRRMPHHQAQSARHGKYVRYRVTQSSAPPLITEFGLYKEQGL